MMAFLTYTYERPARKHFRWWHNWAVRSRLPPIIDVARTLKRRFENIVTYLRHRITNAASESLNANVARVKLELSSVYLGALLHRCPGRGLSSLFRIEDSGGSPLNRVLGVSKWREEEEQGYDPPGASRFTCSLRL
jgi:hypothetical protein